MRRVRVHVFVFWINYTCAVTTRISCAQLPMCRLQSPPQRNSDHGTPSWMWSCPREDLCPTIARLFFHILDVQYPWTLVDGKHLADSVSLRVEVTPEAIGSGEMFVIDIVECSWQRWQPRNGLLGRNVVLFLEFVVWYTESGTNLLPNMI